MMISKRSGALGLAVLLACMPAGSVPALAGAPEVQVDETMYVNMDYYGRTTDINVVKSVGANGLTEFTDRGNYSRVTNMTDGSQPAVDGRAYTWKIPEGTSRFYFEGRMDENLVELPWTFDISYKLNGVPMDASKLYGASGLVEIHIEAEPNPKAGEFYRNNMLLTAIVPVDMDQCYSVDAPGSQTQSLGNTTGVAFMALPGEKGDFTVRLGTDSYKSPGIMMAMVPGRLSDLDKIKDLKEAKDTWRESSDELYDSFHSLLGTMESMRSDVETARNGVGSLESARSVVSGRRDGIEHLSTEAIEDLKSVTEQTEAIIPYLQTAQEAVVDINASTRLLYDSITDTEDELDTLYDRLRTLRNSLNRLSGAAGSSRISDAERQELITDIRGTLTDVKGTNQKLLTTLGKAAAQDEKLKSDVRQLEDDLTAAGYQKYRHGKILEGLGDIASASNLPMKDRLLLAQRMAAHEKNAEKNLEAILGTSYTSDVAAMAGTAGDLITKAGKVGQNVNGIVDDLNLALDETADVASSSAKAVNGLRGVTDALVFLLDDTKVVMDSCDSYVPDMLDALDDTEELMKRLVNALGGTSDLLSLVNSTIIDAGDDLDAGTKKTLDAMRGTLGKTLDMLDDISGVRKAGEEMKRVLDRELDDLEEENNFLNMDPEAAMVSFTSEENPEPHSLQIIMRTEEIDKESTPTDISDDEPEPVKDSPLKRIGNVFRKLFEVLTGIFR